MASLAYASSDDRHSDVIYDTAARRGVRARLAEAWALRDLVALLARRELVSRFQRSALGVIWIVIPPFVYAAVLWVLFSHLALFASPGVPYSVYVLSGVVVFTFVSDGILRIATAVVRNAVILRRVHVPVGAFAAAAAAAAAASLLITLCSLLVVQLVSGKGIPASALLLPLASLVLLIAVGGLALLVGGLAVLFTDAIEVTRLTLTMVAFLTPIFYPLTVIPARYRIVVELNPIYHFLVVFRALAYEGQAPALASILVCLGSAAAFATAGLVAFAWIRRNLPSVL